MAWNVSARLHVSWVYRFSGGLLILMRSSTAKPVEAAARMCCRARSSSAYHYNVKFWEFADGTLSARISSLMRCWKRAFSRLSGMT
jgi:hypothetical protein